MNAKNERAPIRSERRGARGYAVPLGDPATSVKSVTSVVKQCDQDDDRNRYTEQIKQDRTHAASWFGYEIRSGMEYVVAPIAKY